MSSICQPIYFLPLYTQLYRFKEDSASSIFYPIVHCKLCCGPPLHLLHLLSGYVIIIKLTPQKVKQPTQKQNLQYINYYSSPIKKGRNTQNAPIIESFSKLPSKEQAPQASGRTFRATPLE